MAAISRIRAFLTIAYIIEFSTYISKGGGLSVGNSTAPSSSASHSVSTAAEKAANDLADSFRVFGKDLSDAAQHGADAAREAVEALASGVSSLTNRIDLRIKCGDLQDLGKTATGNLREAVTHASNNWALAVALANLTDFGAATAKDLREALQNVTKILEQYNNIRVEDNDDDGLPVKLIWITGTVVFLLGVIAIIYGVARCRESPDDNTIHDYNLNTVTTQAHPVGSEELGEDTKKSSDTDPAITPPKQESALSKLTAAVARKRKNTY